MMGSTSRRRGLLCALAFTALLTVTLTHAQGDNTLGSPHQLQWEALSDLPAITPETDEGLAGPLPSTRSSYSLFSLDAAPQSGAISTMDPDTVVFGYHPSYRDGLEYHYRWHALTHVGYAFVSFNASGDLNLSNWSSRPAAFRAGGVAEANGVKVIMVVNNNSFSESVLDTVMQSETLRATLVDNIVDAVSSDDCCDGVSLDLELTWGEATRDGITAFVADLGAALHGLNPSRELSLYVNPTYSSSRHDIPGLEPNLDYVIYSCYPFAGSWSSEVRAVADADSFIAHANNYIDAGMPADKMVLSLPAYGVQWETDTLEYGATIVSFQQSIGFLRALYDTTLDAPAPAQNNYERGDETAWYGQSEGANVVAVWDDPEAMAYKLRLALSWPDAGQVNNGQRLRGVAFWELGWFANPDSYDPIMGVAVERTRTASQVYQLCAEIFGLPGDVVTLFEKFEGPNSQRDYRWRDPMESPDTIGDTDADSSFGLEAAPSGDGAPINSVNAMRVTFDFEATTGNQLFFRHEVLNDNIDTGVSDINTAKVMVDAATAFIAHVHVGDSGYADRQIRMILMDGDAELEMSAPVSIAESGWQLLVWNLLDSDQIDPFLTIEPAFEPGDGVLDTAGDGARDIGFIGFLIEGGGAGEGTLHLDELAYMPSCPGFMGYRINEFRYRDSAGEFVEIAGPAGPVPDGLELRLHAGSDGSHQAISLTGAVIADSGDGTGLLVIGDPGVANVDLSTGFGAATDDVPNLDPSALQLYDPSTGVVYDSVVYEAFGGLDDLVRLETHGVTDQGYPWLGEIAGGTDSAGEPYTMGRVPDGHSTYVNGADFSFMVATPGAANGGGLALGTSLSFDTAPTAAFQTYQSFSVSDPVAAGLPSSTDGGNAHRCVDTSGGGVISVIGDASLGADGDGYEVTGEVYLPGAAEPAQAVAVGLGGSQGSTFFTGSVSSQDRTGYESGYWLIFENVAGVGLADGRADHSGVVEFVLATNDNMDDQPVESLGSLDLSSAGISTGAWNSFQIIISPLSASGHQLIARVGGAVVYEGDLPANGPTSGAFQAGFRENHSGAPTAPEGTWIDGLAFSVPSVDLTPPDAPLGLTATSGFAVVELDWADNTESDLAGYNVLRSATSGGPYTQLNVDPIVASEYVDSAVENGETLHYVVTAVDTVNNESGLSNEAIGTPTDPAPPGTDVIVDNDFGAPRYSQAGPWATSGGVGYDGGTYVYSSVSNTSTATWTADLTESGDYEIFAWYVNGSNRSPAAAYTVNTVNGAQTVTVDQTTNGRMWNPIGTFTLHSGSNSVTLDIGLTSGGNLAVADAVRFTLIPGTTPPDAPTGLVAAAGDAVVTLDWEDNTEPDLASYNVHRSTVAGGPHTKINADPVTVSEYTDDTVENSVTYHYVVTAVNVMDRESDPSLEVEATPVDPVPPGTDVIVDNDHGAPHYVEAGAWSTSSATGYDGGTYRYTFLSNTTAEATWTAELTQAGQYEISAWYVNGTNRATATHYTISATDGPVEGTVDQTDNGRMWSPIGTFTLSAGINTLTLDAAVSTGGNVIIADAVRFNLVGPVGPAAPTGLTAVAGDAAVVLDWDDNAEPDLASHNVLRSTVSGGPYVQINTDPVTVSDFADTDVVSGVTYHYVVTAVNTGGVEGSQSGEVSATPEVGASVTDLILDNDDGAPIYIETGSWLVSGTPGYDGGTYHYAWDGVASTAVWTAAVTMPGDYEISAWYLNGTNRTKTTTYIVDNAGASQGATLDQTVNGKMWNPMGVFTLEAGVTSTTLDAATSTDGNVVIADAIRLTRIPDAPPPAAPVNLTAAAGNAVVNLDWDDNTESDLAGYNVHRSTVSGGPHTQINTELVTVSEYSDSTVSNTVTYHYVVTAVNTVPRESDPSDEVSATPVAPIPSGTDVVVDNDHLAPSFRLTGTWATSGSPGYDGTTYKWVSLKYAATATWTADLTETGRYDVSAWYVNGANRATAAHYTLSAAGGSVSAEVDQTVNGRTWSPVGSFWFDAGLNTVVLDNQTSSGGNIIVADAVRFTLDTAPPASPVGLSALAEDTVVTLTWEANLEPDLAGYNVHRSLASGELGVQINTEPLTVTELIDTDVTNDVTHWYAVTAVDLNGNESDPCEQIAATPTDLTPPAPPSNLTAEAGDSSVMLDWDDSPEPDLAGYVVLMATVSGGPYTEVHTELLTESELAVTDLENEVMVHFVITAVDTHSNVSDLSAEISALPTDMTPPAVPTGLTAEASRVDVTLDWDDNTEADLAGYNVYRATEVGGPFNQINTALVSSSELIDTDVTLGTTYLYTVTAVDSAPLANESAMSAEVSARPAIPVHVEFICVGRGFWSHRGARRGYAVVWVLDDESRPFRSGDVTGTFSGDFDETHTATTNRRGLAFFRTDERVRGRLDFTFTVDDIVAPTAVYDPSANRMTSAHFPCHHHHHGHKNKHGDGGHGQSHQGSEHGDDNGHSWNWMLRNH
jgi:fibronectin type 3 domain-containing protein/spore germination protein YaaH